VKDDRRSDCIGLTQLDATA